MAAKLSRRSGVDPFIVMEVMRAANARVAQGGDVLHMEVGQPSSGAPRGAVDALKHALDQGPLGYTEAMGDLALRRRIARHYADTYGVAVPWERVAVTTGSSAAFLLSFLAAFDPGDRVVLTDPSYPCYRNILGALGVEIVNVPVGADTRFQATPAVLDRVQGDIAGLVVASPSNPTGSMLGAAELAALAGYCDERGIRLVSDEIYHGIVYGEPAATALASTDQAIVINSFSKYFSMTGWRVGWMVLPEAMVGPVERLAQNLFIAPPSLSQVGALAAFDCTAELDANVARYARNRALLLEALPRAGIETFAPPDGAFYLYADIGSLTDDSRAFCARLLAETGVAATPGIDFDAGRGNRFMRFSFAGATEDMAEAARRIARWLGRPAG
ncbi:MAG: pyridoxal phosphate-dependent aminotransferase [Alphaproteobacteria bacterium]